jgi:hypothetical protein
MVINIYKIIVRVQAFNLITAIHAILCYNELDLATRCCGSFWLNVKEVLAVCCKCQQYSTHLVDTH